MKKNRLQTIASLVNYNSVVADIGTDHGLVPIYLSIHNISKKIIASDISSKSLQKLVDKLDTNPVTYNIETRVSNGLDKVKPFEMDTILISGMGGFLIIKILSENLNIAKTANNLILQANNSLYELRRFLILNGFKIIDERDLFENNKYYQVIKTQVGSDYYKYDYEYEYGKLLIKNKSKNLKKYLDLLIIKNKHIINSLEKSGSFKVKDRIIELESQISKLMIVRNLVED